MFCALFSFRYWYALWLWLFGLAAVKLWAFLKPMMFPEDDGPIDPITQKRWVLT